MPEGINKRDINFLKTKPMASKLIVIIKELRIQELRYVSIYLNGGVDETRTRDLWRDRPAF